MTPGTRHTSAPAGKNNEAILKPRIQLPADLIEETLLADVLLLSIHRHGLLCSLTTRMLPSPAVHFRGGQRAAAGSCTNEVLVFVYASMRACHHC